MKKVYIVGTCDTKGPELGYARKLIEDAGVGVCLVDVGTSGTSGDVDVSAQEVAACHEHGASAVLDLTDRGPAVTAMSAALVRFLATRDDIGAVLGLGGSGNTALVTAAMRSLPVGLPKLMVSTVASGNVAPYVGPNDIAMMYSVADIAGINTITRSVIGNAAHAAAGMVKWTVPSPASAARQAIGMTMFGVTTPCITRVREALEDRFDCLVFHATGTGGQSMEKLVDSNLVDAVIDITTTEVADFLFGGVFACTEDRFGATARSRKPAIVSVGAVDMVNFGARETVPPQFRDRTLHVHNAQVTLMRTTAEENAAIGKWIAEKLNACEGPIRMLLPLGGVSAIDAPGQPFHDPEADAALFEAIRATLKTTPGRQLIELDHNINDDAFADAIVTNFTEIRS